MALTYEKTIEPLAYDTRTQRVIYYKNAIQDEEEEEQIEEEGISSPTKYNGHLEIIPRSGLVKGNENDVIYITGGSGSGKSYVTRTYACNYHRMFPKNRIYYFTTSDESRLPDAEKVIMGKMQDSNIRYHEWLRLERFHVDEKLTKKKFDLERDFANSLVIFDDFLYFQSENKKQNEMIMEYIVGMVKRIINLGRKIRVSCVITSHLVYEQKNPDLYKNIFGETNKFIWCQRKVHKAQVNYALKTYFALENRGLRKAMKFDPNSHYICLSLYPKCLQSENRLEIVNDD